MPTDVVATAFALLVLGACGRGGEAAPQEWCVATTRLMFVLDQHSTTAERETLAERRELAPDTRGETRAVAVLGRYPVDGAQHGARGRTNGDRGVRRRALPGGDENVSA